MAEPIKTVEAFRAWTHQVKGEVFVYRGMADAHWEVESSADRSIRQPYEPPPPSVLQTSIEPL